MDQYLFADYLRSNVPLSEGQLQTLLEGSRVLELDRGAFVMHRGDTCHHRFFIERGAVREYSIDSKGREHLLLFAVEGWFLVNVESVFFGRPSSYFIQTIEPTRIRLIEEARVQSLAQRDKAFDAFDRSLLYEHIQSLQHRITALQGASAEERYLHFVSAYPEVLLRVPQGMVASYLGIAPESLSRIRKALADRYKRSRRIS